MHNVEIKLRCRDLDAVRRAVERAGARFAGELHQTDTFFAASAGRLKLRRCEGARPVLIGYRRDDRPDARTSTYHLLELSDDQADALERILALAAGRRVVVAKRRRLYLLGNARIDLDRVEGLGDFVEFEIVGEDDPARGAARIDALMGELGLTHADRVAPAYADLLDKEP